MKIKHGIIAIIIIALFLIAIFTINQNEKTRVIIIFHAGSLSIPFDELSKEFEKKYGIEARREAAGSIATIKKVTELGKRADIVASADHILIEKMMEPKYAKYCIQFATNRIVIAYTEKSKYSYEINESNWYKIMERRGVRFGFSDPNKDPCGYRAMMVIQLASLYYNDSIFENLIEKNTPIRKEKQGENYTIIVPDSSNLASNYKIMIRPMEIDLMAALETNEIDYLFIYKSVAMQHASSGVKYIELPSYMDLSSPEMMNYYRKVSVKLADGREIKAAPIIYGITIPENAEHEKYAIEFLKFLLSPDGQQILKENGLTPLNPAICDHKDLLPESIKQYVE